MPEHRPQDATASDPGHAMLDALELLHGIAPATRALICQRLQRRKLGKGELLFSAGDASDTLYIVAAGRIRIWTNAASGAEVTLNVVTQNQVFGEIGMLDGGVRTAGASAMAATELTGITRGVFFEAMRHDPQLASNVIEFLCRRLRWVIARMEDAALCSGPQRLARILMHLAQDHGRPVPAGIEVAIELSQGELAQWTMMSRESLNRAMSRWSTAGIVSQTQGRLTVHQLTRIEEIGSSGE